MSEENEFFFETQPIEEEQRKAEAEARRIATTYQEGMRWVTVETTTGLLLAEMTAQRLIVAGIPASAWQEGAGHALGLTVGLLGEGHVLVPEEYALAARELLEQIEGDWQETEEDQYDDEESAE